MTTASRSGMLGAGVCMQRWVWLWVVAVGACVARPPSAVEDAGVADAGVDEEPPVGEPFGRCRITPDCRPVPCSDRCVDGIGCIDATPTSTCAMWRDDPAGGLARCTTADAPAWPSDDFPGHYAPAPLVGPGPHVLTATQPGDVDCVTVVAPGRGVVEAHTTSGRILVDGGRSISPIVDVGEHVRVCLDGHERAATLQVDVTEGP